LGKKRLIFGPKEKLGGEFKGGEDFNKIKHCWNFRDFGTYFNPILGVHIIEGIWTFLGQNPKVAGKGTWGFRPFRGL